MKNRLILLRGSLVKAGVRLRVCECKELKEEKQRFLVSMKKGRGIKGTEKNSGRNLHHLCLQQTTRCRHVEATPG